MENAEVETKDLEFGVSEFKNSPPLTVFGDGKNLMVLHSDGRLEIDPTNTEEAAQVFVREVYKQCIIQTDITPFTKLVENLLNTDLVTISADAIQRSVEEEGNDSPMDRGDAEGLAKAVIKAITESLS